MSKPELKCYRVYEEEFGMPFFVVATNFKGVVEKFPGAHEIEYLGLAVLALPGQ